MSAGDHAREKFPGRVPVVIERASRCTLPVLNKTKYMVPYSLSIGEFQMLIRKRLLHENKAGESPLKSSDAIFLFIKEEDGTSRLPMSTAKMVDEDHASRFKADGCLHITYAAEETYG